MIYVFAPRCVMEALLQITSSHNQLVSNLQQVHACRTAENLTALCRWCRRCAAGFGNFTGIALQFPSFVLTLILVESLPSRISILHEPDDLHPIMQGLNFTGIVVRTPAVPGKELCVCGANHVCESQDCRTVVYPIRSVLFGWPDQRIDISTATASVKPGVVEHKLIDKLCVKI